MVAKRYERGSIVLTSNLTFGSWDQALADDAVLAVRACECCCLNRAALMPCSAQCEPVSAWHRDNDLPLLRPIHARHRALLFRLIDLLDIRWVTQDRSLLNVWTIVSAHTCTRGGPTCKPTSTSALRRSAGGTSWSGAGPRSSSTGARWRSVSSSTWYTRCKSATSALWAQLLPWSQCKLRLSADCAILDIPERGRRL